MAEGNVMRGHRRSIREPCLGAHVKDHPVLGLGVLDPLAQKTVGFTIDVRWSARPAGPVSKKAFIHDRRQGASAPLARVGVH